MSNIQQNPPDVKATLAARLDELTHDAIPAPDHPDFDEYRDTLREYREWVRGPVRESLDAFKAFEFPPASEGIDSAAIVDALRAKRIKARNFHERGYNDFTMSQQIDSAAAVELAEGEFDIAFAKYLEDQFGLIRSADDPPVRSLYAYTHHNEVCRTLHAWAKRAYAKGYRKSAGQRRAWFDFWQDMIEEHEKFNAAVRAAITRRNAAIEEA
jgi:hypothetical protein